MSPQVGAPTFPGLHTAPSKLLNGLESPYVPHGSLLPLALAQGEHSVRVEAPRAECGGSICNPSEAQSPVLQAIAWSTRGAANQRKTLSQKSDDDVDPQGKGFKLRGGRVKSCVWLRR